MISPGVTLALLFLAPTPELLYLFYFLYCYVFIPNFVTLSGSR